MPNKFKYRICTHYHLSSAPCASVGAHIIDLIGMLTILHIFILYELYNLYFLCNEAT